VRISVVALKGFIGVYVSEVDILLKALEVPSQVHNFDLEALAIHIE